MTTSAKEYFNRTVGNTGCCGKIGCMVLCYRIRKFINDNICAKFKT